MSRKTSEAASVETPEVMDAKMKRSIQMKIFFTDEMKAIIALAKAQNKPPAECEVVGGQIIGRIFEVREKTGELPNGETNVSLVAIGEFECVNYATGEVFESTSAFLPGYYLESVKAALGRDASLNGDAVLVGAEILCVATGKGGVPYAYEIRNIIPREVDSPMNRLKARIQKTGKLRLAPPLKSEPIDALPAPAESQERQEA